MNLSYLHLLEAKDTRTLGYGGLQVKIVLSSGMEIVDAEQLVKKFYAKDAHELYDKLEVPQDNKLDLVCLASLAFFEVQNPELASWRSLWSKKLDIEARLQKIPPSLSIVDEDIPWEALSELFNAFLSVEGFRCPRVSKILHKKRPALVPILDGKRVIKTYYQPVVEGCVNEIHTNTKIARFALKQEALKYASVMTALVKAVRNDILLNRGVLENIQRPISFEGLSLTLPRIFDIILWEHAVTVTAI